MFENYKNLSRGDALTKAAQQPHYKTTGEPHIQTRCNGEEKNPRMPSVRIGHLSEFGKSG